MPEAAYQTAIGFLVLIAGFLVVATWALLVMGAALEKRLDRERKEWERKEASYIQRLTGVDVRDTPSTVHRIRPYGTNIDGYLIEQERLKEARRLVGEELQ